MLYDEVTPTVLILSFTKDIFLGSNIYVHKWFMEIYYNGLQCNKKKISDYINNILSFEYPIMFTKKVTLFLHMDIT